MIGDLLISVCPNPIHVLIHVFHIYLKHDVQGCRVSPMKENELFCVTSPF